MLSILKAIDEYIGLDNDVLHAGLGQARLQARLSILLDGRDGETIFRSVHAKYSCGNMLDMWSKDRRISQVDEAIDSNGRIFVCNLGPAPHGGWPDLDLHQELLKIMSRGHAKQRVQVIGTGLEVNSIFGGVLASNFSTRFKCDLSTRPILTWTKKDEDSSQTATLGIDTGDCVDFTLFDRPTCYRRGRYCLLIEVCPGPNHHVWGCFDDADQPTRYYHKEGSAKSEAEAIACVLLRDRNILNRKDKLGVILT